MYAGDFGDKVFPPLIGKYCCGPELGAPVDAKHLRDGYQDQRFGAKQCLELSGTQFSSADQPGTTSVAIGWEYYGGLTRWDNAPLAPSRTLPVPPNWHKPNQIGAWRRRRTANICPPRIAGAQPGWGADGFVQGQPARVPHPVAKGKHPDGGNILFSDGSARWIKYASMYFMDLVFV